MCMYVYSHVLRRLFYKSEKNTPAGLQISFPRFLLCSRCANRLFLVHGFHSIFSGPHPFGPFPSGSERTIILAVCVALDYLSLIFLFFIIFVFRTNDNFSRALAELWVFGCTGLSAFSFFAVNIRRD